MCDCNRPKQHWAHCSLYNPIRPTDADMVYEKMNRDHLATIKLLNEILKRAKSVIQSSGSTVDGRSGIDCYVSWRKLDRLDKAVWNAEGRD